METQSEDCADTFIVLGSQTEESELPDNPTALYQQLGALSNDNVKMVNAGNGSRLRRNKNGDGGRTVAGSDQDANSNNGGSTNPAPSAGQGGRGAPPPDSPQPGGSGASHRPGGGGGGDDGNDPNNPAGGNPDVNDDSEEENTEENTEETTSSDPSEVPPLIKVDEQKPPRTPRNQAGHESSNGVYPHYYGSSESDTGGISDAPTAVVSDTDGEGQVLEPKVTGTVQKREKLLSSETSSMSCVSGSSETELDTTVKLRPSTARMKQQPRRLKIMSTQEMQEQDRDEAEEDVPGDDDNDGNFVLTPAEHLGSLQFSGQTSHVLESADDSDVVPPSQDYEIPIIVPTSPTATDGPSVSYRSPRHRRMLRFPSYSPRRHKVFMGAAQVRERGNGKEQGKSESSREQQDRNSSSSNNAPAQPQQWAPSASLSITSSSRQSGGGNGSSDSPEERQSVPAAPAAAVGDVEEEKKTDEEKSLEEGDATTTQASSVQMICPVHGVKQEQDETPSQDLVLVLSQSQSCHPSSAASSVPPRLGEPEEKEGQEVVQERSDSQPLQPGSQPQTSSVGEPTIAEDTEATFERETESPSQPRFTFDRPTFEEVPEGSEKEKNYSVFKKAIRQRREAKVQKMAPDSSSGDDPFAFHESQPPEVPETSKGRPKKRKLEETKEKEEAETKSKRAHFESPEPSEKMDLGPPQTLIDEQSATLEYEYTALRHPEVESANRSKTPGEASTPQEAMRSLVMDAGSSEEITKEKEKEPSAEDTPRRYSPISNSAPEFGSKKSSKPRRPPGTLSAGEGAEGVVSKRADVQVAIQTYRDKSRRRYQALQQSTAQQTLAQSPQIMRFMASQEQQQPQEEARFVTVKQVLNNFTTYKIYPSGKMEVVNNSCEMVSSSIVNSDSETSPASSKSSHPSIASGELADISSLSRSSGDHSSGSFSRPSLPTVKKKSPSSSSSCDPTRQSISEYMKRMSTFSSVSSITHAGEDVPIHRQRTISNEDPPEVPSTSAQADHSSDAARSVAQSEALFSTPPSSKTDNSVNRTTSTSGSSLQCAQPLTKSRTSDSSSAATTSAMSLVLSPTHVSLSSTDAVVFTHKERTAKQESFESSRSRSSSGGKSLPLFSDTTTSSHQSSETSRRSEDGLFRVPSIPARSEKAKQKSPIAEQPAAEAGGDDTIVEEEEESLTPQAVATTPKTEDDTTRPFTVQGDSEMKPAEKQAEKDVEATSAKGKGKSSRSGAQRSATKGRGKKSGEEKSTSSTPLETPQTVVSTKGDSENKGYPVYAQWRDKYFYPGHIIGEEKGGRYKVRFEDGDSMQVRESDIILVELLPQTQDVFAEKSDNYNELATVLDHVDVEGSVGYLVKFNDGTETRLERAKVIMSPDQAKEYIRFAQSKPGPGTPKQDAADVSLDNLVEGKRKRGGSSVGGTPPKASTSKDTTTSRSTRGSTPGRTTKSSSRGSSSSTKSESSTKSTSSTKKGSTAKKGRGRGRPRGKSPSRKIAKGEEEEEDLTKYEEEEEDPEKMPEISHISDISGIEDSGQGKKKRTKRKLIVEPTATSTPTPQKRKARITSHEDLAEPLSPLEGGPKRSPRRSKLGDSVKGPIPSQGSRLFQNMKFFLTHVEKMDPHQPPKGRRSDSNDESSFQDDETEVPFDKEYLTSQIEAGGGVILDSLDLDEITDNCYCISDSYQRTLKYLHCLATGVICLSHVWIHNCCSANRVLDYKAYVLPAGLSIERKVVLEQNVKKRPFEGRTILIASDNPKFQNTWTDVLVSAKGRVIHTLPSKAAAKDILVALADKNTPGTLIAKLKSTNVDIVSSEWVIQCLIAGNLVKLDGHPRYTFDYEPPEKAL